MNPQDPQTYPTPRPSRQPAFPSHSHIAALIYIQAEGGDPYLSPELKYGPSTNPSTDQTVLKPYSSTKKTVPQVREKPYSSTEKPYSTTENRTQTVPKPRTVYSVLSSSSGLFALDRYYRRRKSRCFLFLLPICRAVFISHCLSLQWNFLF